MANADSKKTYIGLHPFLCVFVQEIPGVPKIKEGFNPATWMLEATNAAVESQLKVDFAEIYQQSSLYRFVTIISAFHDLLHFQSTRL